MYSDNSKLAIAKRFPNLHFVEGYYIRGSIGIIWEDKELDRFSIEIDLKPLSDGLLPQVYETGGRIPKKADFHINKKDGSACVCLPEEYLLKNPGPFVLLNFLEGSVYDFFVGQALVARGDPWPHGEWNHESEGRSNWLTEFIKALPKEMLKLYLQILALREMKGHHVCPCGSHERLRDCHFAFIKRLRVIIPIDEAKKWLMKVK